MKKFIYLGLLALGVVLMVAPPVMAQEEKPFTIHGEVRYRGEYDTNTTDFDSNVHDTAMFWPYRVRIAAEGHFSKNVSAWIEIQNANTGGVAGPTRTGFGFDGSDVELYQGNVTLDQLWSKNFSLRIGRQEIVAGNELLLGDLDFYAGITHDGGVGNWKLKKVNLMVWYSRPVENTVFGGNVSPDTLGIGAAPNPSTSVDFAGGYATWAFKKDQSFDVYLMDLSGRSVSSVQTVGARYAHDSTTKDGFIWDAELAQQFGDFNTTQKAKGRAIEGWFGYNWKKGRNVHRVYGRLESATGDKTSSTDYEGFVPMFGDFHNRTGRGDWFRLQDVSTGLGASPGGGIVALSAGYNGFYNDRHEFGVAYWKYELQEDNGAASKDLGKAFDVWYGFNYSRNVNFVVSLSQLNPDDALTGGGTNDSVKRLYGQARLRF